MAEFIARAIPEKYKIAAVNMISFEILKNEKLTLKKNSEIWCNKVQLLRKYSFSMISSQTLQYQNGVCNLWKKVCGKIHLQDSF